MDNLRERSTTGRILVSHMNYRLHNVRLLELLYVQDRGKEQARTLQRLLYVLVNMFGGVHVNFVANVFLHEILSDVDVFVA